MRRIKKRDHENLTSSNIEKVISLLNPEEGKPISKKDACEILNIAYNTTRLNKIIQDHHEQKEYIAERKRKNKGKPATESEIAEAVTEYLQGEAVANIAKSLYRSPNFIKSIFERVGVPERPVKVEDKQGIDVIPDECTSETFSPGEIVWSSVHHCPVEVVRELSLEYQNSKKGFMPVDYEAKYSSKCYEIYVMQKVESEDSFFPGVEMGGYSAFSLAYDLGKLSHLEKYGVKLNRI